MPPATKGTKKPAARAAAAGKDATGFTAEERAAMRERVRELKQGAEGEAAALAAIRAMKGSDRTMGERLHAIIRANAPGLTPKTWYGMPAYANADGKVVCFFRGAGKFKERYLTLGFQPDARLDDGNMWATSFALTALGAAEEQKIAALVRKAVG